MWLGKLTALDMTPLGWLGHKTSTQANKQYLPQIMRFEFACKLLPKSLHEVSDPIFWREKKQTNKNQFVSCWISVCPFITKICLYNFDPLKPHFYIVTGVYIIFLISAQKHRLWVLFSTAWSRQFYQVPTIYVLSRNMKNIRIFYSEIFHFLVVKFSV